MHTNFQFLLTFANRFQHRLAGEQNYLEGERGKLLFGDIVKSANNRKNVHTIITAFERLET